MLLVESPSSLSVGDALGDEQKEVGKFGTTQGNREVREFAGIENREESKRDGDMDTELDHGNSDEEVELYDDEKGSNEGSLSIGDEMVRSHDGVVSTGDEEIRAHDGAMSDEDEEMESLSLNVSEGENVQERDGDSPPSFTFASTEPSLTLDKLVSSSEYFSPLYPGADITLCGAMCAIMQFSTSNNLSYTAIGELLKLLDLLCPSQCSLPKTFYAFKQFFSQFSPVHDRKHVCTVCMKSECSCDQPSPNDTADLINLNIHKPLETVITSNSLVHPMPIFVMAICFL